MKQEAEHINSNIVNIKLALVALGVAVAEINNVIESKQRSLLL